MRLFGALFFNDFWSVRFFSFFVIWGAPMLYFGKLFGSFLGALGHWKNSWKCVTVIKFKGLALPNCIIFDDILEGALKKASGTRCLAILSDFGLHGRSHLAFKKQRRKKVFSGKSSRRQGEGWGRGGGGVPSWKCGSLKTKSRPSRISTVYRTGPYKHALRPKGTVADKIKSWEACRIKQNARDFFSWHFFI